jgi:H+-transporting ATPase
MIRMLDKSLDGLTSAEVEQRLREYGRNQLPEQRTSPVLIFARKFWGPIPWMLEITMALQLALGKTTDALIIAVMLLVNAVISFIYERSAQSSLALLRQRLTLETRVLRDGKWQKIPSQDLVPGDIIRLRVGDIVPADVRLIDGVLGVDQSSLTGESELADVERGGTAYAASIIRRGEGIAEVAATGPRTSFSQTARLVQTAKTLQHGEAFIQKVVGALMALTGVLVVVVVLYGLAVHLPTFDVLLFTLALLIAAIPVSLPVTFTLATAVGSRDLAKHGVLVTRLPAIKEAAGMDVLCSDKTGTITLNELTVVSSVTYGETTEADLLCLAALASDDATHDPIDVAIVEAARAADACCDPSNRLEFTPFDPATKRTEALVNWQGETLRVVKGLPHIVRALTSGEVAIKGDVERLASQGWRCIAIAAGPVGSALGLIGLLALQDPPREDSATVVTRLQELGVRVMMITGDGLATAASIAQQVGITGPACPGDLLRSGESGHATAFGVYAGVYPEDKYTLVKALQKAGHVVGMTGDGINDAPAIRQAEIGVAMANATDITKSAAGLVLTAPGLRDMLAAVEVGRRIFQRMSTYTLNKIVKTFHLGLFLSLGLLLTGTLVANPTHILLLVLANDLVSMSLTTDNVRASRKPNRWKVAPLVTAGLILALAWVAYAFFVLIVGRSGLRFDLSRLQTLMFVMLVCAAQANVYLIRERGHFWRSRPSKWMLIATTFDLLLVALLAIKGVFMVAIDPALVLSLAAFTVGFMVALDFGKVALFRRLRIS